MGEGTGTGKKSFLFRQSEVCKIIRLLLSGLGKFEGLRVSKTTWIEFNELGKKARELGLQLVNRNKNIWMRL